MEKAGRPEHDNAIGLEYTPPTGAIANW
jgi:hypothetical protein